MPQICPTILAENEVEFAGQMQKVSSFHERLQIDLMDGVFAKPKSIDLQSIWWSPEKIIDIHLMYQNPFDYIDELFRLKPHMVIVHVETMVHHMHFAAELHSEGIKAGLAILPETPVVNIEQILSSFDHLLIFSGNLGHFGGEANLELLNKVREAKEHHPDLEIGWDGGVVNSNVRELAEGGVDVLNAGGYIQGAENPKAAYEKLVAALK
jgi:ribulose-phosphate 3-epimerase